MHLISFPFRYRAMYEVVLMPWDWPVEVNYHEAKAYCDWRGPEFRLPIEAEHHVMRGQMVGLFSILNFSVVGHSY